MGERIAYPDIKALAAAAYEAGPVVCHDGSGAPFFGYQIVVAIGGKESIFAADKAFLRPEDRDRFRRSPLHQLTQLFGAMVTAEYENLEIAD